MAKQAAHDSLDECSNHSSLKYMKKKISKTAKIVQLVRTLISCVNNENSNFSLGLTIV